MKQFNGNLALFNKWLKKYCKTTPPVSFSKEKKDGEDKRPVR